MFGRKGDVGIGVIFIIVLVILFFIWLVTYSQRECRNNDDCGKDSYCGSDFSCHKYPVIIQEKITRVSEGNNLTVAAFLLGLSLVVAAVILRSRSNGGVSSSPAQPGPRALHRPTHGEGDRSMSSSQYFEHYGEPAPHEGAQKHH